MRRVLSDAMVAGYEGLAAEMVQLGKDAHVLAAAVRGGADVIVTSNVRDFLPALLDHYKMLVQTPDEFLLDRWWLDRHGVVKLIIEQSAATARPHLSPTDLLTRLRDLAPEFVQLAEPMTRA
jgi:hypothetical protein